MYSTHRPVVALPAVVHGGDGRVLSVSVGTPLETVVRLLVSRQLAAVPVVDEYGVPVGVVLMSSLMSRTDVDPLFAGLARRRWYEVPAGATAADAMIPAAPKIGYGGMADRLPVAS